ncbi:phage replication initiation protein, NGO0469 family [Hymenobacter properus]|uniref:Uncharacterized protein n=1 Tax=Hymenobacter properus TaxID=2791026 RepID=A0A931BE34_9BACT|nr:hypothetical protein [Hymenobacter properus]MBF9140813.1 hypothetical protein [Hymenobacter properus]MBR7719622.1 hypothetical protein [Microvirga sp. SRT04]
MATLIASASSSTTSAPAPAGNHAARCVGMIQIGTVSEMFEGKPKLQHKVRLTFELPHELKEYKEGEGEKPALVSKNYTLSMHEKATLRNHLESWRGKPFTDAEAAGFDILVLLGKPCMLNVVHKTSKAGKEYAEIKAIASLGKGMSCPDQLTPSTVLTYDDFNWDVFDKLPSFIREDIESTPEFKALVRPGAAPAAKQAQPEPVAAGDEDLPF